jgi:hypothetical protein
MGVNSPGGGGGGGLIIGDQPLDYWLSNFAFMLPAAKRNRCLALLSQYEQGPMEEEPTLFLLECAKDIVRCWNGMDLVGDGA